MPAVVTAYALAPYAAFLALMFLILSLRVGMLRGKERQTAGSVDSAAFTRAQRVQVNFAEYVPFALLLIWLCALTQSTFLTVNIMGALLVIGRLAHAYGLLIEEPRKHRYYGRAIGMGCTALVFFASALLLTGHWFGIL